uniref:F-box domain-containing protein n=1 Tax=Parastrongyloides trichosuri TaxID=131310 RepID=A0A0N5A7F1_PARTI
MSISSFPRGVLKKIFQYVDWKTLKNVRLVSRLFNDIVESYEEEMQKPELYNLSIDWSTRNDGSHSLLMDVGFDGNINLDDSLFINVNEDDRQYAELDFILNKMNFNDIDVLEINTDGDTRVFDILRRSFENKIVKVNSLDISVHKYPNFENFIAFLRTLTGVKFFALHHLCFEGTEIPTNFFLPPLESIIDITIMECPCTNFMNEVSLKYLFENNHYLESLIAFTFRKNIEKIIIDLIIEHMNFIENGECINNDFEVTFARERRDKKIEDIYLEHFHGTGYQLIDVKNLPNISNYTVTKECSFCSKPKVIVVKLEYVDKDLSIFCNV